MGLPRKGDVSIWHIVKRNAIRHPGDPWVSFFDGEKWTWGDALSEMARSASFFVGRGVGKGDVVAVLLGNGPDFVRCWLGCCAIGAVMAPLHAMLKGEVLVHALNVLKPKIAVADRLSESVIASAVIKCDSIISTVLVAETSPSDHRASIGWSGADINLWDDHVILMTSGTTGQPKGVPQTYLGFYVACQWRLMHGSLTSDDIWLLDLPLCHSGGLSILGASVFSRCQIAMRPRPDLRNYWATVAKEGVTVATLISTMVPYLVKQPPSEADRRHRLKKIFCSPLPEDIDGFKERFGIEGVGTVWGMSEGGPFTVSLPDEETVSGECGTLQDGFDLLVADEHDMPLPDGVAGEALVRHRWPWVIATRYLGDSKASAEAWRNGWFHTGDVVERGSNGHYRLVGRKKDMIRRRGENISALQVEKICRTIDGIADLACLGVCEGEEVEGEEVKLFVVFGEECDLDEEAVFLSCAKLLPYFMVPRFIQVVDSLPKTTTMKINKDELARRYAGHSGWDALERGYAIKHSGVWRADGRRVDL